MQEGFWSFNILKPDLKKIPCGCPAGFQRGSFSEGDVLLHSGGGLSEQAEPGTYLLKASSD